MRHLLLAALHAGCVAAFFAALLRDEWKPALRFFGVLFTVMVTAVLAGGWIMAWIAPPPVVLP